MIINLSLFEARNIESQRDGVRKPPNPNTKHSARENTHIYCNWRVHKCRIRASECRARFAIDSRAKTPVLCKSHRARCE